MCMKFLMPGRGKVSLAKGEIEMNKRWNGDGLMNFLTNALRRESRATLFFGILVAALMAFEVFNYSTTQYSLLDMLGNVTFLGLPWATLLALAFCGIDFAGIARIFTPQTGTDESTEVKYLFVAWLLAAGFNATLTWWGVKVAITNHPSMMAAGKVAPPEFIQNSIPIIIAVIVWLVRVLIIGTFSVKGDTLLHEASRPAPLPQPISTISRPTLGQHPAFGASPQRTATSYPRPAPRPTEPTYRPLDDDVRNRRQ